MPSRKTTGPIFFWAFITLVCALALIFSGQAQAAMPQIPTATGFSNLSLVAGSTLTGVSKSGTNPVTYTPTTDSATLGVDDLNAELNAGNSVIVITTNAAGNEAGTITVSAAIVKSSGSDADVTLTADGGIVVNANVTNIGVGTITLTTTLNLVVNAGQTVSAVDGDIELSANSGAIGTGNFIGVTVDRAIVTTSGAGNISLDGIGGSGGFNSLLGVLVGSSGGTPALVQASVSGAVTITGVGGAGESDNRGVQIQGADASVKAAAGGISITGSSSGTNAQNVGVLITGSALVQPSRPAARCRLTRVRS
jgi:hypothetical protein